MGKPYVWNLPAKPKLYVSKGYQYLSSRIPPHPDHVTNKDVVDRNQVLHKVPLSQDPNSETLARAFVPHIMVSVSALKAILDNFEPNFENEWEIPFTVQTYDQKDENGQIVDRQKVIFVDKPLPRKGLTAYEKMLW